jgi:hypothetical protein
MLEPKGLGRRLEIWRANNALRKPKPEGAYAMLYSLKNQNDNKCENEKNSTTQTTNLSHDLPTPSLAIGRDGCHEEYDMGYPGREVKANFRIFARKSQHFRLKQQVIYHIHFLCSCHYDLVVTN